MPFNPNIPQATDDLSDSQLDLLNNNLALDASSSVDHYAFSDLTANNGKHKQSTYPAQDADPTTAAGESAIYSKKVGDVNTLFIRPESSGTPIPFTPFSVTATDATSKITGPKGTVVIGAMRFSWGTTTITASTSTQVVSFPVAYSATPPFFSQVNTANPFAVPTNLTATGFSLGNGAGYPITVVWLAIGPA